MRGMAVPNRSRRRATSAVLAALAVAACGGGDLADPVASSVVDPASPNAKREQAPVPAEGTPALPTAARGREGRADERAGGANDGSEALARLEAAWSAARARMVAELAVAEYGIDDAILVGPAGFRVDLDRCPDEWTETNGVDDHTVHLAMIAASSGDHATFADLAIGMQLYFDYVNETGGVDGRTIEFSLHDDRYSPEVALDVVAGLLGQGDGADQPFVVTTVGTPTGLAVRRELNDACVPQPLVVSDHPAWGDPIDHPFTTGFQLVRSTEAVLWGRWIKENLPGIVPVKVGALVIDNEFGRIYEDSFRTWAEANPDVVSEFVAVTHDPTARLVAAEMDQIARAEPDVFLSMTAGEPCISALTEASRSGLTNSAVGLFTASGCRQADAFLEAVAGVGHGFWIVAGAMKSLEDPAFAGETFVAFTNARLRAAGIASERHLVGVGFAQYGWAHVELLRVASALPGGLTRSNVVLASRGIDLEHPMLLPGIRFATDGVRDSFPVEGSVYSRYDADSAAWYVQGGPVDVDGGSPNCVLVDLVCEQ
ncbi:MAG: ABC transporter substrate-binding protein [Acidimicrobiales bacterium]